MRMTRMTRYKRHGSKSVYSSTKFSIFQWYMYIVHAVLVPVPEVLE
jgi:hypothetical protein